VTLFSSLLFLDNIHVGIFAWLLHSFCFVVVVCLLGNKKTFSIRSVIWHSVVRSFIPLFFPQLFDFVIHIYCFSSSLDFLGSSDHRTTQTYKKFSLLHLFSVTLLLFFVFVHFILVCLLCFPLLLFDLRTFNCSLDTHQDKRENCETSVNKTKHGRKYVVRCIYGGGESLTLVSFII
jgi:hypothetical protein